MKKESGPGGVRDTISPSAARRNRKRCGVALLFLFTPAHSLSATASVSKYHQRVRAPLVVAALGVALTGAAAPQTPLVSPDRPFRSGIELTSLAATVTDADGRLITGLDRGAFEIFEDGVRQEITQFTSERVPVGLGVLLDISDSMFGRRLQDARAAVHRFLFELLDESDEFFIVAFNHAPKILTPWTHTAAEVARALNGLKPFGGTAAYDALVEALPMMERRTRQRAALLLISDGADTASNISLRQAKSALLRSDAFVYAIAIDSPERQAINTRVNPEALRELTGQSGGRTEVVHNSIDIDAACARIADELNHQYVLGYTSTHTSDDKYHSIRVRVPGAEYRVRARNGYVATRTRN
jgi:Ca-activated chloride channel homolog